MVDCCVLSSLCRDGRESTSNTNCDFDRTTTVKLLAERARCHQLPHPKQGIGDTVDVLSPPVMDPRQLQSRQVAVSYHFIVHLHQQPFLPHVYPSHSHQPNRSSLVAISPANGLPRIWGGPSAGDTVAGDSRRGNAALKVNNNNLNKSTYIERCTVFYDRSLQGTGLFIHATSAGDVFVPTSNQNRIRTTSYAREVIQY